jgi:hypothetical protein
MGNAHQRRQKDRRTLGKVQQRANRRSGSRRPARVKRQGKSLPPSRQREGQCKPGEEQTQDFCEGPPAPPEQKVGCSNPPATGDQEKWPPKTESRLSRPAPELDMTDLPSCLACCSIGCPHICILPKGHHGKHLAAGDCGTKEKPVTWMLMWEGDFNEAWPPAKED